MVSKVTNESLCLDKRFIFVVLFIFFAISGALFYFTSKPNFAIEESVISTTKSDVSKNIRVVSNITSTFACPEIVEETRRIKSIWTNNLNTSSLACKTFSRSFPSLGGLGCPCPCDIDDLNPSSKTFTITTHFSSSIFSQHTELANKIKIAQNILQEFGDVTQFAAKSFNLNLVSHCCSKPTDFNKVNATLHSSNISLPTSTSILFDQVTCQITGPNNTVTIMLMVDRSSAKRLYNITSTLAKAMEYNGLKNNYFESQYGIAIAKVNVNYPCTLGVRKINNNIYRRNWTTNMIILDKPVSEATEGVLV